MSYEMINSIGLGFDIVGVFLLYKYGLAAGLTNGGENIYSDGEQRRARVNKRNGVWVTYGHFVLGMRLRNTNLSECHRQLNREIWIEKC